MTNAEKRKEITEFITTLFNMLDPTGLNAEKFINSHKKMSDSQFILKMNEFINNDKDNLYLEFESFENEPNFETIEKAADYVGDKYVKLFDYMAMPEVSGDPNNPVYTTHKIFNGYINMRRVQQIVDVKNHIPTSVDKRDPKTNQVTQESKAARVSDVELFSLLCQNNTNILKEMYGPRGGDPVMRDEMNYQISTAETAKLSDMHDNKLNKTSLNTADAYMLAAGFETDLVTKKGILKRTINKYGKDANTVKRKETSEKI